MSIDLPPSPVMDRTVLRARLRAAREAFVASPQADAAAAALAGHLVAVLVQLEPRCLGLYWPIRSEFNAVAACASDPLLNTVAWALPYTHRPERHMDYRAWDGEQPTLRDECGLPTSGGESVEPDVVLLPCVGYTDSAHRLGYGAGYFDRWLAAHPGVTAVGVAWSVGHLAPGEFVPEPHDLPMMAVVTELGVIG